MLHVPAPNAENHDKNPPRIAARNLFDVAIGHDRLFNFGADRYRVSLQLTAVNIANKYALFNFLSTVSGMHLTPQSLTAEISLHF